MKKIICFLVSTLLVFTLAATVFAQNSLADASYSFMPGIDGKPTSLIHNEYYKLYYNEIFEAEYANLKDYNLNGMTEDTLSVLNDNNYIYATVILKDEETTAYKAYNESVVSTVIDDADILFTGDTTPFTVVKLTKADADELLKNESVAAIFKAFFPADIIMTNLEGRLTMGNVTGDSDVTASDARFLLRFAANLETVSKNSAKMFYFCADMNFDGSITSADARLALRTASGLVPESSITFSSTSYWNDFAR